MALWSHSKPSPTTGTMVTVTVLYQILPESRAVSPTEHPVLRDQEPFPGTIRFPSAKSSTPHSTWDCKSSFAGGKLNACKPQQSHPFGSAGFASSGGLGLCLFGHDDLQRSSGRRSEGRFTLCWLSLLRFDLRQLSFDTADVRQLRQRCASGSDVERNGYAFPAGHQCRHVWPCPYTRLQHLWTGLKEES